MSKTKKLSKVLALVIMLALVIGILPMGAMASVSPVYVRFFVQPDADSNFSQLGTTVSVTSSDNTAYTAITAAISSLGSSVIATSNIDANGINSINGYDPGASSSDSDAWLYTVNDRLAQERISDMSVSAGDVITVFYTADYTTTLFAYIVPDGAPTSGNAIAADSGETVKYRVATSTVDFNNLYSTILSTDYSKNITSQTYIEETPSVSGYKVIKAYKRVVSSSGLLSNWRTDTQAAYTALTQDQKTALTTAYSTIVSDGNQASATMNQVNALAYIVAPYTRANSAELKRLVFTQSGDYLNITQTATGKDGFDPDVTSYRLQMVVSGLSVSAEALSGNATVSYSSSGTGMTVTSAGAITFSAGGSYTLTVTVSNEIETGNTVTKSYTVTIPYTAAATSNVPKTVCGYLPIGQFARPNSMGWGTIYTDNTNVYASTKTPKFAAGYVSTGVSLGMLGGYVQFEFEDAIGNDADNPYGIDFIVYGNAFNGNPEAGAVMVYGKNTATNTDGWYNLAGSRHYTSGTIKNENITYIKITGSADDLALNSDFTAAGIYYSKDFVKPDSDTQTLVDAQIGAASWTSITTATGWWPEINNGENYEQVWKMHRPDTTTEGQTGIDSDVGGVYWYQSGTALVIRYEGVTEVIDSNTTNDYQWGYADVRANGSSYGTAINPYATSASTGIGGDGFDLSWAVDKDGKPVNLTDVKIVRVYSAVLFNAGVFGETSTEVNGIYVASGTNSDSIVNPTVTIGNESFAVADMDQIGRNVYLLEYGIGNGSSIVISNYSTANVLINGSNQYSYSSTSSNPVQIIVQNGDAEPVIIVIT